MPRGSKGPLKLVPKETKYRVKKLALGTNYIAQATNSKALLGVPSQSPALAPSSNFQGGYLTAVYRLQGYL